MPAASGIPRDRARPTGGPATRAGAATPPPPPAAHQHQRRAPGAPQRRQRRTAPTRPGTARAAPSGPAGKKEAVAGGDETGRDPPHTALSGVPSPRPARRCLSAAGGERRPPAPPSCPPLPTSRRYGTSKAGPAGPFAGKTAFVRDKLIKPKSPSPVEETGHREAAGRRRSRR